jgi:hypothetical protein
MYMSEFLGLDVVAIDAPQDRNALEIHVIGAEGKVGVVRFANDDGTPVIVEFSAVSIRLISDRYTTLGEFEALNPIEGGYEVVGDFGIIWVNCKTYSYAPRRS